jgi:hypothetical protein
MADQATAIMAAMLPLTVDTLQHITVEVTPPDTTADIDPLTMLPPITVPGTTALRTDRGYRYRW